MRPDVERRPEYGRLAGLSWLHFLNDGAANYLPGVLPAVLLSLGQNVALAGAAMTALMIGQALQPATGWLADQYGGRALIVVGMLSTSLGGALIGWAPSLWLLVPLLLVMGATNAVFHPQAMAGARMLGGSRQGLSMALFLVGGEIGRGIWPLLASIVVVRLGLGSLWLLGIPALLSAPLLWRHLPVQPPRRASTAPIDWALHARPAAILVGFTILRALAIFGSTAFLPVLWHARGHSLVAGAGLITVLLVVGIVGNIGGGAIADRIGQRPVLLGSSLLGTALLAAFIGSDGVWQWLLLGTLGIMLFASLPLSILIAQDLFPENRSFGSGLALGLSNGVAALLLIPLGWISESLGAAPVLKMLCGVLLSSALLSLRVPTAGTRQR